MLTTVKDILTEFHAFTTHRTLFLLPSDNGGICAHPQFRPVRARLGRRICGGEGHILQEGNHWREGSAEPYRIS